MNYKTEKECFERHKKLLLDIIHEVLPGCRVLLFGSRARGQHASGADVDIALDMGRAISTKELFLIRDKIENTTIPLLVDVVDLATVSDVLKREVEREGVLWTH